MFGQWWPVDGRVVDGDRGVVVELDPLVAALETALPIPRPSPTVPPSTAKPTMVFANRLLTMFPLVYGMSAKPSTPT
jgi:hypothetical protein